MPSREFTPETKLWRSRPLFLPINTQHAQPARDGYYAAAICCLRARALLGRRKGLIYTLPKAEVEYMPQLGWHIYVYWEEATIEGDEVFILIDDKDASKV